ncbi:uncharacterized protein LOC107365858 isoform X2 [Tetranychus urticae]|uniref:uncharacterized protein LOC107365858 isoform X2 n=1 Tax=Tetranychus urticae TaxID=32264 RepID=UPI00077BBF75|nr:uncharacterized protein LOC107365858 isoform X2 [Tetranychus urticae]
MSENKTTIKVKLGDEDYYDIVIDWTDYRYKYHQQIYDQLAVYTGIPHFFMCSSFITNRGSTMMMSNVHRLWRAQARNESVRFFRRRVHDGDCFTLNFNMQFLYDQDEIFHVNVNLTDSRNSHGNECNSFWCKYKSTRVYLNKIIGILKNSEFQKQIKAEFPVERYSQDGDELQDEWWKLLPNFNLRQYFQGFCTANLDPQESRPYLPHRG